MSESGSTTTKPVPEGFGQIVECGCCFKTQFGNFTNGWISSENAFVAPTRKGETLPKWADLLKNELFVVLEEGESFSTRVCFLCSHSNPLL